MLERGLLHEPGRRWASLTELLAALSLALAKPKPRRRTSRRSIALAVLVGAAGMAALPLIFGQRQGLRAAPLPEIVASASTHAARHVASHRASAADAASDAGATLSPGPSPGPDRGPDLEPGTGPAASPAERGLEATAAAAGVTPPNTDDAASGQTVSGVGKAEAVSRDVCHLHEDTYELLVRGPRKKQLIDAGECFECRLERRRSRTSRFSPGDCGAYALCAPAGEDACP
jgi:hypothetical protein